MKTLFYGIVKGGKLKFNDPAKLSLRLAGLEGKDVQVTVEQKRKQRSLEQNAYYFGVVVKILSEYTGYSKEETHDALRIKFLRIGGSDDLPTIKSTTKLSTKEMTDYIEGIKIWAITECDVFIPDADANIEWGRETNHDS